MEVRIFTKEMSSQEEKKVKDYSATKIEQIERLLKHFAPDSIRLDINAEKLGRRSAYKVEFVLKLHSKIIVGREASHEITKAIDLAKDRVVRQIKKHEELLRDQTVRRRRTQVSKKTYNEKPHQTSAGDIDYHKLTALTRIKQEQRDALIDVIQPHLEKLNKFIKREILLKEASDIIPEREVESEPILNEVILEFYENYNPSLRGKDLEQWLYTVAINQIRSAIEIIKDEGLKIVPIEEGEEEPQKISEDFEYFEAAGTTPILSEVTADESAKKKEVSHFLMDELSKIPERKREAFILHKLEGFLLAQISEMQHRPLKSVKSDVEEVQQLLAQKAKNEFGE